MPIGSRFGPALPGSLQLKFIPLALTGTFCFNHLHSLRMKTYI